MNVTVLEKIPEDPEIIVAWNNLVLQMERPEVFFTQQWALAASRAFSNSLCPLTFLVYESARLCGVAAMATTRESPDEVFFLTASTADYCDIVSAPEIRAPVLAAVLEEMSEKGARDLVLANVPAESYTLRLLSKVAQSHRFHLHMRPAYDCGIISLGDNEQRQAVLQAIGRKEKEKRGLKKLGQLGPIRVAHLTGEQLETGLRPIFVAHISRFFATNRQSPLVSLERRVFLAELARLMDFAGWLKVSQLEVNGRPIAWNYGFRFLDSWFWYLPTFELHYEESSPGSCLLRLLIEEACADPSVKRLDLGLGDEAYKARFSNAIHSTNYVRLSRNGRRHLATVGRHRLAAFAGRFPAVEKRLRGGRDLFHSLLGRVVKAGVAASARRVLANAKAKVVSENEVAFFEAPEIKMSGDEGAGLSPLSWESISTAAMNNASDEQTLEYLARCAQRLKHGHSTGYCLLGQGMQPAHFLWVNPYSGFHVSEIASKVESSDSNAAMIFDCWTPVSQRGHGNYATAIRLAAADLQKQGRQAWIFSAAGNESSLSGILKAGFEYRFSLVRRTKLFHTTLSRHERETHHESIDL